jgi:ketosteroid isomerase-like protein
MRTAPPTASRAWPKKSASNNLAAVTTTVSSALVKIAMTEFGAGDVAGALAMADPLLRWDDRAVDPNAELVWGQEDVLKHLRNWVEGWEDYSAEVEKLEEVGNGRVVVVYTEKGFDRETGMDREQKRAAAVTVERGAITAWARYLTETEAVGAAQASGVSRF